MPGSVAAVICNLGISVFRCLLCYTCRLDIPKAPLLLGQLLGSAIVENSLPGSSLQQVCEPIEDTEARRELLAHVLKTVQARRSGNCD